MRSYSYLFLFLLLSFFSGCASDSTKEAPHVKVSILTSSSSISKKDPAYVGLHFVLEEGWHLYWRNPGDSGLAPKIAFKSEGIELGFGETLWPTPHRIKVGSITNYGYEKEILLAAPISIPDPGHFGSAKISAKADWLVCKEECIPGSAILTTKINLVDDNKAIDNSEIELFNKYLATIPKPLESVSYAIEEQEDRINLTILALGGKKLPSEASFIPQDKGVIENSGAQISSRGSGSLTLSLQRSRIAKGPVERVRGLLLSDSGWDTPQTKAVSIDTSPDSDKFEYALPKASKGNPVTENEDQSLSIFSLLFFAFLGGLTLNLMPCVFPVLAIKALGLVEQAACEKKSITVHCLLFSLGVILSFLSLAGAVLILRSLGESLGWGFQLQYPPFVVGMGLVFLILGFLYLVEIPFFVSIQCAAGRRIGMSGYLGSFTHGIFATAVATPCTAPFMGTAVAAAFSMPLFSALLVFAMLGVGMSAPYLILSLAPQLLKYLPKPGPWMETFKHAMAFPLFASAIWLFWVFARQCGIPELALVPIVRLAEGILTISFGIWLTSRINKKTKLWAKILITLLLIFGVWFSFPSAKELELARSSTNQSNVESQAFTDSYGLTWNHYSDERLSAAINENRYVFVDFTAAWCVTCQVNKEIILNSSEVLAKFKEFNVLLLKGDWTNSDPVISAALEKYGRSGVPLNLVFIPGESKPKILPAVLTPQIVLNALPQQLPSS